MAQPNTQFGYPVQALLGRDRRVHCVALTKGLLRDGLGRNCTPVPRVTMAPVRGRIARRVLHREPMLFRNPFPLNAYRSHQHAAHLARMGGPLLSFSVAGQNLLQLIFESAVTRLCINRHEPPWDVPLIRCAISTNGTSNRVDGVSIGGHACLRHFPAQGHGIRRRVARKSF